MKPFALLAALDRASALVVNVIFAFCNVTVETFKWVIGWDTVTIEELRQWRDLDGDL